MDTFRPGNIVKPYERLNQGQIDHLHRASMDILADPGIWCYNAKAADLFGAHGAAVDEETGGSSPCWRIRLPEKLIMDAVSQAPSHLILGARDRANRLDIDAGVPRVYFGTGSETNIWLETEMEKYVPASGAGEPRLLPRFVEKRGSTELLARAAHLAEQLEHLDFFIRPVNIQDEDITEANHDVNKFFVSLNNITKHVQAGLTSINALNDVVAMAEIIAGGSGALRENPLVSFIACVFKSPLQLVDDTAEKVFAIVDKGLPLVISSSPQGGSSAPIQESGMVAQINAEILTGIALTQLIQPKTPVMYGSVPVRVRLDDLNDLYGCPEFNQYNVDCAQMARFYRLPCYSSTGVANARVPGIQAAVEKLFSHLYMAASGAQYIHYAFGLLDRTNTFSPLQAVLDNEQIGMAKHCLRPPIINRETTEEMVAMERKVMMTSHRLFTRYTRKPMRAGLVSEPYRFESKDMQDRVLEKAHARLQELEGMPARHLPIEIIDEIYRKIPGVLQRLKPEPAAGGAAAG